jgi:cytochrome c-type biogenesis protein
MLSHKDTNKPAPPEPKLPKFWFPILLFLGTLLLVLVSQRFGELSSSLDRIISIIENSYQEWFDSQQTSNPLILISLAFLGGLLASFSPCILALLPVNLSYIGTLKINSRRDAFVNAGLFVLGTVTILSLFGLVSAFASAVIVDYKGLIYLVVGAIILLMGCSFAGWIHLPLPQTSLTLPITGPFAVGLTFALVSSPCASPVLFAVLAAAATADSQLLSVMTMVSYGLGYTAIIFLASFFTGITKQSRSILAHSDWIIRLGSIALILAGGYYIVNGITWFISG